MSPGWCPQLECSAGSSPLLNLRETRGAFPMPASSLQAKEYRSWAALDPGAKSGTWAALLHTPNTFLWPEQCLSHQDVTRWGFQCCRGETGEDLLEVLPGPGADSAFCLCSAHPWLPGAHRARVEVMCVCAVGDARPVGCF